jgi:hypothetical protein
MCGPFLLAAPDDSLFTALAPRICRLSRRLCPGEPPQNDSATVLLSGLEFRQRDGAKEAIRFAIDSPPEEGVSSEPVSDAKFPASRKFTGNFIEFQASRRLKAAKKGASSMIYRSIPYPFEQGIFCWLTGN